MSRITRVTYRRLMSSRIGYGHAALELTAEVAEGEEAERVQDHLVHLVNAQVDELANGEDSEGALRARKRNLEKQIDELEQRRQRLAAMVEADEVIRDIISKPADEPELRRRQLWARVVALSKDELPF